MCSFTMAEDNKDPEFHTQITYVLIDEYYLPISTYVITKIIFIQNLQNKTNKIISNFTHNQYIVGTVSSSVQYVHVYIYTYYS